MRTANLSKHLNGLFGFIFVICLLPLFPTVAEGQSLDLTGTWNFNSFVSGPSAPWWERGTLTVAQDGTFSGSGTESNGNTDSPAGSFSISSNGIVMTLNGQSATPLCQDRFQQYLALMYGDIVRRLFLSPDYDTTSRVMHFG